MIFSRNEIPLAYVIVVSDISRNVTTSAGPNMIIVITEYSALNYITWKADSSSKSEAKHGGN